MDEPSGVYLDISLAWSSSDFFLCHMTDYRSPQQGVVVTVPELVEAAGKSSTPAVLNSEIPGI